MIQKNLFICVFPKTTVYYYKYNKYNGNTSEFVFSVVTEDETNKIINSIKQTQNDDIDIHMLKLYCLFILQCICRFFCSAKDVFNNQWKFRYFDQTFLL